MQGWKPHESKKESLAALHSFIADNENWGKYKARYVSYVLSTEYWDKGYMTEALNRIIQYVFEEMHIDLLSAFHYPHNSRSERVLKRCGFQYEITITQGQKIYNGQIFDTVCYSILAEDYFNKSIY